jgi:2-methylaconitate cis-trans-isomerase PrpF
MSVNASFWRGGTSRGLLLRARDLAQYSIIQRENIIYTALGTGDARQIDGLGGGVSSLSKVAIIGLPKEGLADQKLKGILPGVDWADEGTKVSHPSIQPRIQH